MRVRGQEDVLADGRRLERREPERLRERLDERRPGARQARRDEDEQLVDEPGAEERGGERRSALEQERLDALAAEPSQLVLERAGHELELRGGGEGGPAQPQPARPGRGPPPPPG